MKTIKNVVCEVMAFSGEDGGYYFPVASFTSLAEERVGCGPQTRILQFIY